MRELVPNVSELFVLTSTINQFPRCDSFAVALIEEFSWKEETTKVDHCSQNHPSKRSKKNGWIPGLTSQRASALISSDSEMFQFWFSAVHCLKISGQR